MDTLKIGGGLIGVRYGIENYSPEETYNSIVDGSCNFYDILNTDIAGTTMEFVYALPDNEIVIGFTIGIVSNLTAFLIKEEYGGFRNFIRGKKVEKGHIHTRFL